MTEAEIQQQIQLAIGSRDDARLFRNNQGQAWVARGKPVRSKEGVFLPHGAQYHFGLPTGSPDLVGIKSVTVTPEMVGQVIGLFMGVEVKTARGRVSAQQRRFIEMVQQFGGIAGVARSEAEAMEMFHGGEER
ncbi:MAG: VRR-NUC domain-containing protein [Magnetococcales bacterium]|nr:VRR-NUC domain-containing protein [Magnetococcales bacterium]